MNSLAKLALLATAALGSAAAQAQRIEMYVSKPGGFYRVAPGSGTGGRLVRTSPQTILGGIACVGYTDRIARGEDLWVFTAPANGVNWAVGSGFIVEGQAVNYWSNHPIPTWDILTIPTNPNLKRIYHLFSKAPGAFTWTDVPIGSR